MPTGAGQCEGRAPEPFAAKIDTPARARKNASQAGRVAHEAKHAAAFRAPAPNATDVTLRLP
ncbi:hypothetical protein AB870_26360 [Pandoraea faecigallinarum]|nr:hypothetical protein AB870_26360 [Pandoraea faecigallinarum]